MEYQMEELLPLVSALTDKFTSKESSSVTYETAQMLMEAVLFCIQEYEEVSGESPVSYTHLDVYKRQAGGSE